MPVPFIPGRHIAMRQKYLFLRGTDCLKMMIIAGCSDGTRPVISKIERMDGEE